MKAACAWVNGVLGEERRCGLDASQSGSSAFVAFVCGSQLLIANAGDQHSANPRLEVLAAGGGGGGALCQLEV